MTSLRCINLELLMTEMGSSPEVAVRALMSASTGCGHGHRKQLAQLLENDETAQIRAVLRSSFTKAIVQRAFAMR